MKRYLLILWVIAAFLTVANPNVSASSPVDIEIKTILASQDSNFIDPALSGLIGELQSVFRYSSYRLLSGDRLRKPLQQTGSVSLPGNRVLEITPLEIDGNRVKMKLVILKGGAQAFSTVVQLRNRDTLTVGGPRYQGGYLLFNISASF